MERHKPRLLLFLVAVLIGLPVQAAEFYCCHESAGGRRVCGDTLPEACRGKAYRVYDQTGNPLREVEPPASTEQKARQKMSQEAEALRRKEEEEAQRLQRRKDQALLETYSSLEDVDAARQRAEADVADAIRAAQNKIGIARQQRKKYEEEAEFYKKKGLPAELDKGLKATELEVKTFQQVLEAKQQELEVIKKKYEEDRRRFQELRSQGRLPKK